MSESDEGTDIFRSVQRRLDELFGSDVLIVRSTSPSTEYILSRQSGNYSFKFAVEHADLEKAIDEAKPKAKDDLDYLWARLDSAPSARRIRI